MAYVRSQLNVILKPGEEQLEVNLQNYYHIYILPKLQIFTAEFLCYLLLSKGPFW